MRAVDMAFDLTFGNLRTGMKQIAM
jgi:hypothetical protein